MAQVGGDGSGGCAVERAEDERGQHGVGEIGRHGEVIVHPVHSHCLVANAHHIDTNGCVARSVAGSVQLAVDLGTRCGEDLLNTNVLNDDAPTFIKRVCWTHWHKCHSLMTP